MTNEVERSLSSMIIGTHKAFEQREARRQEAALDDTVLLFQGSIEGHAGSAVSTTSVEVDFDAAIYNAPGLKDTDLDRPQFNAGIHLENGTGVLVSVHVVEWKQDEEQDATVGAVVEIAVTAPGVSALVQFTANLHLTFRGLGAPLEDESELA